MVYGILQIGSLLQGPNEPDKYWTQPGHPLNPDTNKGGRFKVRCHECLFKKMACVNLRVCYHNHKWSATYISHLGVLSCALTDIMTRPFDLLHSTRGVADAAAFTTLA